MKPFESFALHVLRGMRSPIIVVNDRIEVVTANESGWELMGESGGTARGRALESLLHPTDTRMRTPLSALQAHDNLGGWSTLLRSEVRHFPHMAVRTLGGTGEPRVLNLEVSPTPGEALIEFVAFIRDQHPDWIEGDLSPERVRDLITPKNSILFFQDVTDLAICEARRQECMRNTLDVVVRTLDHYIRNALTPILGYSDLIRRKGQTMSPEEVDRITDQMARNVHLITAVLDALRMVRDIHVEEPLGANSTLIGIEKDLKARLAKLQETGGNARAVAGDGE